MKRAIPRRKVSLGLGMGIVFFPIVFSWLLLRKGHSTLERIIGFCWLALFLLPFVFSSNYRHSEVPKTSIQWVSPAQQKTDVVKPTNTTDKISSDSMAVKQIAQRIKDKKELLKKYYATSEHVNEAATDALFLAATKASYSKGTTNEEKDLYQLAFKLLPQAQQQVRELYASSLEEVFVKNGMDIKVRATGRDKNKLRIVYALMSQPLVYKFQNEVKLDEQAKNFGFSKLIYINGFESSLGETWTVDLK
jgi:hypothetical protein